MNENLTSCNCTLIAFYIPIDKLFQRNSVGIDNLENKLVFFDEHKYTKIAIMNFLPSQLLDFLFFVSHLCCLNFFVETL